MDDNSKSLSIIAYYLSKYDLDAVNRLGYDNRINAMREISLLLGKDNSYLKLRRDEFDVLTDSHRSGWRNRAPTPAVKTLFEYMEQFSFDEVSNMAAALIEGSSQITNIFNPSEQDTALNEHTVTYEEEIEQIINYEDNSATVFLTDAVVARRKYNKNIIKQLKELYLHRCQICLFQSVSTYGKTIAEAHHISHFIESHNNNSNNIIILCPNHHRIIHAANPIFSRERLEFEFLNGHKETLTLNYHL